MKYVILLVFTFLSVSIYGYGYGISANHAQVLPFIHYINNPLLYQGDPYIQTFFSYPTFYCHLMANLARIIPLETLHLGLYIVLRYILLLSVFHLSIYLFASRRTAFLSCFLFAVSPLTNLFTLLGEDPLMRSCLYQTSFVSPFVILAILFFLRRRYFVTFFILAFIYYINGLIGNFLLVIFLFGSYIRGREIWRYWIMFLVMWVPWLVWYINLPNVNGGATTNFLSILKVWYPGHYFPSRWSLYRYKDLIVFLLYFCIFFKFGFKNSKEARDIKPFLLGIITMWSVAFVFGEFIPIRPLVLLQFFRSDVLFISIGLIFAADYIRRHIDAGQPQNIAFAGLLLLTFTEALPPFYSLPILAILLVSFLPKKIYLKICVCIFLALCIFDIFRQSIFLKKILLTSLFLAFILVNRSEEIFSILNRRVSSVILTLLVTIPFMAIISYRIFTPDFSATPIKNELLKEKDFKSLQCWVSENTPIDTRFITPPYMIGFRVFSKRSTFIEWIDAACMHWSPGFEKVWVRRLNEMGYNKNLLKFLREGMRLKDTAKSLKIKRIYASIRRENVIDLAREYGIDYIVIENKYNTELGFSLVYINNSFSVYKITKN